MKIAKYIFTIVLLSCISVFAQDAKMDMGRQNLKRIEQLENAKLIQELDLKEEQAVRFFARRKEYREKHLEFIEQRKTLIDNVIELLKNSDDSKNNIYKEKIDEFFNLESKIIKERKEFYKSLWKILTPKQILKLAIFDDKFRKEIRESLMSKSHGNKE